MSFNQQGPVSKAPGTIFFFECITECIQKDYLVSQNFRLPFKIKNKTLKDSIINGGKIEVKIFIQLTSLESGAVFIKTNNNAMVFLRLG